MPKTDHYADYYATLGVAQNADLQSIKRAYRAKATISHPDHGGSHDAMLRINEAYEILANPLTRRHYDEARANKLNQAAQQQAQADASRAKEQAEQYPPRWTDFESWLAKDFAGAEYGQWGWFPTASKSGSGVLFIITGLTAGGIVAYALGESHVMYGRSLIMVPFLGGFIGQWIHKQIGKSIRPSGSPSPETYCRNSQSQTAPRDDNQVVVRCPKCNQQLRVPTSQGEVKLRCPACQFQFDVKLPAIGDISNQQQAKVESPERAAHDKGVGLAFIVGIIAFIVLLIVCRDSVGDGFIVEQESLINWPGVIIGTGICAFIGYQIGKSSKA